MDVNTLLENMRSVLAQDVQLSDWSNLTYGQTHKIYVNMDTRVPPGEDDCPYIAFYPTGKTAGDSVTRKRHIFEIICCIYDSTSEINPDGNITEYEGVSRIEDFRKMAEDALGDMNIGNVHLDVVDIEYDTIESFPFMMAAMEVTFGQDRLIGVDPLE